MAAKAHWKLKKLIQDLDAAKGSGTSMISLLIKPSEQIARVSKMLSEEYGAAGNIKSRVNRLSVQSGIMSAIQKLKLYPSAPKNGLALYCGTVSTANNKERKVSIAFEPFRPIGSGLYKCGDRFDTEYLKTLLVDDKTFGFVIVDGCGTLFGTLTGDSRQVLHKIKEQLPKKQRKGGQSAQRYGRIRQEKRKAYVNRVAEHCNRLFIDSGTNKVNVAGLVIAGLAEIKCELTNIAALDSRIKAAVVCVIDVPYGGLEGFKCAIKQSAGVLSDLAIVREQRVLGAYFEHIRKDSGLYVYGTAETKACLEAGAVETLIAFGDHGDAEWFVDHCEEHGARLEIVTDQSQEGSQFLKGFGGIGGILRWRPTGVLDAEASYSDSDSDDDYFI